MKIFILEDTEERIKRFCHDLVNHKLFVYDNVDMAKEDFNKHGPYDAIFLDHDLDQKIFVDSDDDNTGYKFAVYMSEQGHDGKNVIIHTLNPAGARRMMHALPKAQYVPFINIKRVLDAL